MGFRGFVEEGEGGRGGCMRKKVQIYCAPLCELLEMKDKKRNASTNTTLHVFKRRLENRPINESERIDVMCTRMRRDYERGPAVTGASPRMFFFFFIKTQKTAKSPK